MKCPYCGSEMEKGDLLAPRGIHWVKKGRGFVFAVRKSKGDIKIIGHWPSGYINSYVCRKCGKIIIDIPAE